VQKRGRKQAERSAEKILPADREEENCFKKKI
jgi:hypothetical protein